MIRHNVIFKVKSIVTDEEIQAAFQILFELKKVLPGFLRMAASKCKFFENKGAIERLYGFSIDFADENAYNNFLNNPVTDFAKATLINIIVDGYEGIYGFDVGRALDSYPNPLDRYRIPVPRLLPPGAMR